MVAMTDPAQFIRTVDEIARLVPPLSPAATWRARTANRLQEALAFLRDLPTIPMAPLPGQADLDALLLAATTDSDVGGDTVETADETALVSVGGMTSAPWTSDSPSPSIETRCGPDSVIAGRGPMSRGCLGLGARWVRAANVADPTSARWCVEKGVTGVRQ